MRSRACLIAQCIWALAAWTPARAAPDPSTPLPPQVGASPYAVPLAFPAGQVPYPAYSITRYDEDYSYLADRSKRADATDALKYIPLGSGANTYLTLGGDFRLRFDDYHGYPANPALREHGGYLLQRYIPYADLHLGSSVRVFTALISAWEDGARPAPVVRYQQAALDLDQLFVDLRLGGDSQSDVTVRVGRQELSYGAGRLIAPREGPNERQPFDAARVLVHQGAWRADLLYARPVQLRDTADFFQLHSSGREQLWGLYATRTAPLLGLLQHEALDVYYLGYVHKGAAFADIQGREQRHTFGARIHGSSDAWQYDLETIGQTGDLAGRGITAWALSGLVGHLIAPKSALPVGLTFGLDVDSGTAHRQGGDIGTFNPLFPRVQYFTEAGFFAPANLIAIHPGVNFHPSKTVALAVDAIAYWRESRQDVAYNPALRPLIAADNGKKYLGTQAGAQIAWQLERHTSLLVYYAHLFPGDYFRGSQQRDADYVTAYLNVHL